jgi:hypothetical protein
MWRTRASRSSWWLQKSRDEDNNNSYVRKRVCLSNKNNSLQNLFIQIILSLSLSLCMLLFIYFSRRRRPLSPVARARDFRLERKAKILSTKTLLLSFLSRLNLQPQTFHGHLIFRRIFLRQILLQSPASAEQQLQSSLRGVIFSVRLQVHRQVFDALGEQGDL